MVLGPPRVNPGHLSVSRTFGDIKAKFTKYGGREGVVIAKPEISQFTIQPYYHDFIMLGCDGIFDRMTNERVLDIMWNTINIKKRNETLQKSLFPGSIHRLSASITDAVIREAAVKQSLDNLTVVVLSFKNLETFYHDRTKPDGYVKVAN